MSTAGAVDRGSTLPLLLGFVVVGALVTVAAVAVDDTFVAQRELQSVCDGAAAAAAADAIALDRRNGLGARDGFARFADVRAAAERYLARDVGDAVSVSASLSADGTAVALTCVRTVPVPFGAAIGEASGVRHVAHSTARAALSDRGAE
jgi:hypothetical protein